MEKSNARVNADLLDAMRGEGKPMTFTPEELNKCKERYKLFNSEESEEGRHIRIERANALNTPEVYLTF